MSPMSPIEQEADSTSPLDASDDDLLEQKTKKHSGTYTFNAHTGRLTLSQPERKGTIDVYV